MKYVFVADASIDVPQIYLDKYDIHIIPIEVNFGEERFPQGMATREFYKRLQESEVIPKTAMPNAYKFEQFYKAYVNNEDYFVVTLLISMEMSPTKLQAQMAAENLGMKNVFIEECCTTTIAQGAILGELARFCERTPNVKPDEVIKEFYRLRSKVRLYAVINDLKYLKNSGRLSSTGAIVGSMLKVKPVVSVVDGKVVNVGKVMGSAKAIAYLKEKMVNMDKSLPYYPAHTDNLEEIELVTKKCSDIFGENQEKIPCEIGYVVGTHVGPKVYGFVFFEAE